MTQRTSEANARPFRGGHRLMKFNPEINTGTIIQIATIVVIGITGVVTLNGKIEAQQTLIETNRLTATRDNVLAVESLKELKGDVKELQKSTNEIKESLAILRGRAAEPRGGRN